MNPTMCCTAILAAAAAALGGELNPPAGPVAPTPGPEPRTAINATNTPGDADSVFRISQPGSYYLASNIAGAMGENAIEVEASNVTIDLNGFSIIGVPGALSGIRANFQSGITVRNGVVRDFPTIGIVLFGNFASLVEQVHLASNGTGLSAGGDSIVVRASTAVANLNVGFFCGQGAVIEGCTARSNGGDGISVGSGSAVVNCSASDNEADGIDVSGGGLVKNCSAFLNQLNGINATIGVSVIDCTSRFNVLDGIRVGDACVVRGNMCHFNGNPGGLGTGISATGTENRIEGNNCTDNDIGVAAGGTVNLIFGNSCRGNAVNYAIVTGNRVGTIVVPPVSGAINGNSGGAGFGTTDPWANFAY